MQDRASRCSPGVQRDHAPTVEDPFTVVLVDEVAFLTAYQPDQEPQGPDHVRAGHAGPPRAGRSATQVVAALQDPRKDVLTIRNLFPDRIAMAAR